MDTGYTLICQAGPDILVPDSTRRPPAERFICVEHLKWYKNLYLVSIPNTLILTRQLQHLATQGVAPTPGYTRSSTNTWLHKE
ncbi:hypothetical protein RRG08_050419 [Elysia crispata]|uniref:Uncharacterized protein n=1 Tax=Elysia crispata TaxID=231223 RepID=A0AAE0ZKW3_9GAST|nr:hypothetical protein RRG08_050419 [Elysia crispata]